MVVVVVDGGVVGGDVVVFAVGETALGSWSRQVVRG